MDLGNIYADSGFAKILNRQLARAAKLMAFRKFARIANYSRMRAYQHSQLRVGGSRVISGDIWTESKMAMARRKITLIGE